MLIFRGFLSRFQLAIVLKNLEEIRETRKVNKLFFCSVLKSDSSESIMTPNLKILNLGLLFYQVYRGKIPYLSHSKLVKARDQYSGGQVLEAIIWYSKIRSLK